MALDTYNKPYCTRGFQHSSVGLRFPLYPTKTGTIAYTDYWCYYKLLTFDGMYTSQLAAWFTDCMYIMCEHRYNTWVGLYTMYILEIYIWDAFMFFRNWWWLLCKGKGMVTWFGQLQRFAVGFQLKLLKWWHFSTHLIIYLFIISCRILCATLNWSYMYCECQKT